ncbi:hypothetical protein [Petrocella sp. FN5]|uniref:hypothetical protein n=1 Tax=Petrocella sp. FN5 TaxID=3032002 RepID=UPI0023DAD372|nr:hypothetical protein [Petrocella sp. FN5]MDF1618470.1 hypothetical protein [Petrocella sp. FN5]
MYFKELKYDDMLAINGGMTDDDGRGYTTYERIVVIKNQLSYKARVYTKSITGSKTLASKAADYVVDKVFGDAADAF